MKILLMSMGTRGDMEPFLALGELLLQKQHDVVAVLPAQFEEEALNTNLRFYPFDKRFMEMLESEEVKNVLGQKGSAFSRFRGVLKMYKEMKKIQSLFLDTQWEVMNQEQPDIIIFHPKIYIPVYWIMDKRARGYMLFPLPNIMHPVKDAAPIPLSKDYGKFINLTLFRLMNYFQFRALIQFSKKFHHHFPNIKITNKNIRNFVLHDLKSMIMISRTFFKKPDYWKDNIEILGYRERDKTINWKPSKELTHFINNHNKILFISFGSMVNPDPDVYTRRIISVLKKHNISAIINTYSGGLEEPENYPNHIHFTKNIPYDWLFPKCFAVMHHGGAGTTHMGVKYNCVTLVIPHSVDQFFWNKRIAKNGLGPLGVPIKKLTKERFEPLLLDVWNNINYQKKVKEISDFLQQEDYTKELLNFLEI